MASHSFVHQGASIKLQPHVTVRNIIWIAFVWHSVHRVEHVVVQFGRNRGTSKHRTQNHICVQTSRCTIDMHLLCNRQSAASTNREG